MTPGDPDAVTPGDPDAGSPGERDAEDRAHVRALYVRLDELRARARGRLDDVRRSRAGGNAQNRSERDAQATLYEDRLRRLDSVEERLVFGRLDLADGTRRYIGRIGLTDDDIHQLLVDWRAPAAEPFYRATAASPAGVLRRRHLAVRGRELVGAEEETLDIGATGRTLTGEAALLAAVNARRTGRMGDIVATIQAEQDRVIRSPLRGVLVVQGGPGTGKTAVALHRSAYLLFSQRDRLSRSGVLLVGPSPVFLRYIEQVLPSLGETGVVLQTLGDLVPGVRVAAEEPAEVAAVKGDPRMAGVLAAAVRDRQRVPDAPVVLDVDGVAVRLDPADVAEARSRARRSRRPHNEARTGFVLDVLRALAARYAEGMGTALDSLDAADVDAELRASAAVRAAVNRLWPHVTPEQLLAGLYADPDRLASAAPDLDGGERALLLRDRRPRWTLADVPLLDEAAELLGEDDAAARAAARRAAAERAARREYAAQVLASSPAAGLVGADVLADRYEDAGPLAPVAERAAADRTWAYGHVVVDEAQELSPMAWRMLARRCPGRSMTLVGDVAQVSAAAGVRTWASALDPWVRGRWRVEELTVNYRTPAAVMRLAAAVLDRAGVRARVPTSVREGDAPPWALRTPDATGADLVAVVRGLLDGLGEGRMAVVSSRRAHRAVAASVAAALPDAAGTGTAALDRPVAVLPVDQAKGLEFDAVVVVEPAGLVEASPRGVHDLYVAMTRPTQQLVVVHARPLPPGLEPLEAGS